MATATLCSARWSAPRERTAPHRSGNAGDHAQPLEGRRRGVLRRPGAREPLHQHQGSARLLGGAGAAGRRDRGAGRGGHAAAPGRDAGRDPGHPGALPSAADAARRRVRHQPAVPGGAGPSAGPVTGIADLSRRKADCARRLHRPPRRHGRLRARQHAVRRHRDLPGGAADPAAAAGTGGALRRQPAAPDQAERTHRLRGARRPDGAVRGRQEGRAASRRAPCAR